MRCSLERESHLINQIFIQRKSPCSTLYKECQGWSKEIFYIVISGFVGCFETGASSYFLSCINSRLVSEKTSAGSGVNVRMFSEIYRDVFLFFVQKIKMFVQIFVSFSASMEEKLRGRFFFFYIASIVFASRIVGCLRFHLFSLEFSEFVTEGGGIFMTRFRYFLIS